MGIVGTVLVMNRMLGSTHLAKKDVHSKAHLEQNISLVFSTLEPKRGDIIAFSTILLGISSILS